MLLASEVELENCYDSDNGGWSGTDYIEDGAQTKKSPSQKVSWAKRTVVPSLYNFFGESAHYGHVEQSRSTSLESVTLT